MQKQITRLRGLRHLMCPDPRKVTTPEEFNAHLDRISDALSKERIEIAAPAPEPTPEPVAETEREQPDTGNDRQEKRPKRTRKRSEESDS